MDKRKPIKPIKITIDQVGSLLTNKSKLEIMIKNKLPISCTILKSIGWIKLASNNPTTPAFTPFPILKKIMFLWSLCHICKQPGIIKKVGKKDPIGFQKGDSVNTDILDSLLYDEKGYPRPEGTNINIKLKRNGKSILLPYKIEYKERKYKHRLLISKELSKTQSDYYAIWRSK